MALVAQLEKSLFPRILTAARWIKDVFSSGNKVLLAGNGGSAADAQHLAAEFIGRFQKERPSLPAIALTTDTSILTAIGNDYGFHRIFSRQIEGLVKEGDLFLSISTSGYSKNLVEAVEICRRRACRQ
jgi:D-sedoheptulose 7-phosphate isomerase